jgi:hypothetical protein
MLTPEQRALLQRHVSIDGDGNVVGNDNTVRVTRQAVGVYVHEIARIAREISDPTLARELAAQHRDLTRVHIPGAHTWDAVRRDPTGLGDLGLRDAAPDI